MIDRLLGGEVFTNVNSAEDRTRTGTWLKPRGILSPVRLPISPLRRHFQNEATPGFEPGDKGFAGLCLTTWLCRHTKKKAGNGTRTRDNYLGKVELYQLSYSRVNEF